MDSLADHGSRWFCAAAHVAATPTFEMQACGDGAVRYGLGVATIFAALVLGIVSLWLLAERRAD